MEPHQLFAHQGGWDEVVLVLIPLALLWIALMVASRRARRRIDDTDT